MAPFQCCVTGTDADPVRPGRAQDSGARLLVGTVSVALVAATYIGRGEHAWSWAVSSMGLDPTNAWGSSLLFFLYEIGRVFLEASRMVKKVATGLLAVIAG